MSRCKRNQKILRSGPLEAYACSFWKLPETVNLVARIPCLSAIQFQGQFLYHKGDENEPGSDH
jgi:hypothetical protein